MYPKFKTQALIKKYAPFFISKLGMKKFKIEFHVYHSSNKTLKEKLVPSKGRAGLTYSNGMSADVILLYDSLVDRKDALSTLIHELLHVRLTPFTEMITLNRDRAWHKEEALIRSLEKFIMETIDFEKLLA